MNKARIYIDINEMVDVNNLLLLLSKEDSKQDSEGNIIYFYEGMSISVYMDDIDENGKKDNILAEGIVELNTHSGWSSHVKWCCRIDKNSICYESEVYSTSVLR